MSNHSPQTTRLSGQELREHHAHFLERFPWELFGTVTTKRPMSEERAEREVWPQFEREVRRRLGHRFDFVRVKEPFEYRPGCHIHFLALDCEGLYRLSLVDWAWHHIGKLHLVPYNPALGAGHYITKYVVKDERSGFDVRFSPRCYKFKRPASDTPLEIGAGLVGDRLIGTRAYLQGAVGSRRA